MFGGKKDKDSQPSSSDVQPSSNSNVADSAYASSENEQLPQRQQRRDKAIERNSKSRSQLLPALQLFRRCQPQPIASIRRVKTGIPGHHRTHSRLSHQKYPREVRIEGRNIHIVFRGNERRIQSPLWIHRHIISVTRRVEMTRAKLWTSQAIQSRSGLAARWII